jgi:GDP-4-dehydro-6-deoxy-D-mannose reductase
MILVTGASGFAGRHLLKELASGEADIVAWCRPGTRADAEGNTPAGVRAIWREVDLLDRAGVEAAVADAAPEEIYHLAAAADQGSSFRNTLLPLSTNVRGTHHLLDTVRRVAPRARVLVTGSASVYRPRETPLDEDAPLGPTSPYGLSKLAQEQLAARAVEEDGLALIITRSFNHLGPGQATWYFAPSFARQIALAEAGRIEPVIKVGNLESRRDLTDVRDTVRAYRLLMASGRVGVPYNVCRGEAFAIADVADMLRRVARRPVELVVDPARFRPVDTPLILGDPSRLRRETGWAAEIPLSQTIADVLAEHRALVSSTPVPH